MSRRPGPPTGEMARGAAWRMISMRGPAIPNQYPIFIYLCFDPWGVFIESILCAIVKVVQRSGAIFGS
jgi:hypothetical protein